MTYYREHLSRSTHGDALESMGVDPGLLAIDPSGCGCTECMVGEYRPADQASEAEIKALLAGLLVDNTSGSWDISQVGYIGSGFDVSGPMGLSVHVDSLDLPLDIEHYTLQIDQENVLNLTRGETTLY